MTQKYGVVRLDDLTSALVGHIESVVYKDGILENGMIGVTGDLLEGERELMELKVPTGTTEPVVLIASPELNYVENKRTDYSLENFYIPVGTPARGYDLVARDKFSVSKKMIKPLADEVAIGAKLSTADGSLLMTEIASPTGSEAFLAKVIGKDRLGTATVVGQNGIISRPIELIAVEVIKNHA